MSKTFEDWLKENHPEWYRDKKSDPVFFDIVDQYAVFVEDSYAARYDKDMWAV